MSGALKKASWKEEETFWANSNYHQRVIFALLLQKLLYQLCFFNHSADQTLLAQ